jgi:hypothetical protein
MSVNQSCQKNDLASVLGREILSNLIPLYPLHEIQMHGIELDYTEEGPELDDSFHSKVIQIVPDNYPELATNDLSDRLRSRDCWKFSQADLSKMNEALDTRRGTIYAHNNESLTIILSIKHIA